MFDGELRRQKALFAAADQVALLGAFTLALELHDPAGAVLGRLRHAQPPQLDLAMIAVAFGWMLVFRAFELYRLRNGGSAETFAVIKACTVALFLPVLLSFVTHVQLPRLTLLLMLPVSMLLVLVNRAILRRLIRRLYSDPKIAIPVVIAGQNPLARYIADRILDEMTQYELLGFVAEQNAEYRQRRVLGGWSCLGELAALHGNLEVLIVLPDDSASAIEQVVRECESHRIHWRMVPPLFGALWRELLVDMVGIVPLIGPRCSNIEGLNFLIKRGFDLAVASAFLLVTGPVMLAAALALRICDGRPLLFRQIRIGIHGMPFELLKFRTMRSEVSDTIHREFVRIWISDQQAPRPASDAAPRYKLTADPRVTPLGRWLRRFSIDELPQLINVLRGDMSLIGPRPALPYELELYQSWHRRRLDAPPGITGLWQVSGRNLLSFDEMVRLDIDYITNWSLGRDLRILLRTLPAMLNGGGL
jgi:exopolysaccharide biosynthesis polyprenyl glycosylphosphotransferase